MPSGSEPLQFLWSTSVSLRFSNELQTTSDVDMMLSNTSLLDPEKNEIPIQERTLAVTPGFRK